MRKNGGIFKNKMEEDIEMKIYHAQVNHLENPMGFRMERTVFSWKVKDAEGKKQSYAKLANLQNLQPPSHPRARV
jgi:hypothetical protein